MKWLLRPWIFVLLGVLLLLGAAAVIYNTQGRNQPTLAPLAEEEEEIVWLYPATNVSGWSRFVTAVRLATTRLKKDYPQLEVVINSDTFLDQSNAVSEVALCWSGSSRRLTFRWYKVTSDRPISSWVKAIIEQRKRPPLAIIGGSSSDVAQELACELAQQTEDQDPLRKPLLLITTATACEVPRANPGAESEANPDGEAARADIPRGRNPALRKLVDIYPDHTFRYCFTNNQMADAVTQLIWSQDDLRPDGDPVNVVKWEDDSYSLDLISSFLASLRSLVSCVSAQEWTWVTGSVALPGPPPGLGGGILPICRLGQAGSGLKLAVIPVPLGIDSSVGAFALPNRFEMRAAQYLEDAMRQYPDQERTLLIVTGQAQPMRRFLRYLASSSPLLAQRAVVATGDAISFNTVYRDRYVSWPIQDLPFPLVFFCHQNPVDPEAGFRPDNGGEADTGTRPGSAVADYSQVPPGVGTEDILLYADIVESLIVGYSQPTGFASNPPELAERLRQVRFLGGKVTGCTKGELLFDRSGNRNRGTGEHLVCVRPHLKGAGVLPQATIEVWAWRSPSRSEPGTRFFSLVSSLKVRYD